MKKLTAILTALTMISAMTVSVNADTAFSAGDVDMDGAITGHDAAMVSRYVTESDYSLTAEQLSLADMDGDGSVTQADADMIYNARLWDLGDMNKDGQLELEDCVMILQMCNMKFVFDKDIDFGIKEIMADVDCNGILDYEDFVTATTMYGNIGAKMDRYREGTYGYVLTEKEKQDYLDQYRDSNGINEKNLDFSSINAFHISAITSSLAEHMDVDKDGELTVSDATAVLTAYANNATGVTAIYGSAADAESTDISSYDVNYDDEVDLNDASLILKTYAMSAADLL